MSQELLWWITAIDIPALSGLLLLIWKTRRDMNLSLENMRANLDHRSDQMRDALSSFKLEVAKHYASQGDLRDLERRLVAHLLRIEAKLDATALKAEAAVQHK